jgi:O-antigen/teichoic acid export membrane protein
MMMDDPNDLNRRAAYLDQIRGMYRRERTIGIAGCLIGVMLLIWSRYRWDAPHWAVWVAVAVIAAAWTLFAYVIFKRTAWVRAHPFDPNG